MIRVLGLLFLGLLAFAITVVLKFPAAGVLPHVNISPYTVNGVSGSIWRGNASQVLVPELQEPLTDVNWRFLPRTLLQVAPGLAVDLDALGGQANAQVQTNLAGDLQVSNGNVRIPATGLQQFLPLPVAQFDGVVNADINAAEVVGQQLKLFDGQLTWRNAVITGAVNARLGQLVIAVAPDGQQHRGTIKSSDGELDIDGEFELDQQGNYKTDIKIKPLASTSPELTGVLGMLGRRSSDGSYRVRQSGNLAQML